MDRQLIRLSQKQLFLDDAIVEQSANLTRTFHQASKHPANPIMVATAPWEDYFPCQPNTVLRDAVGQFRMWYNLGPNQYAVSEDGIHWRRPPLGLIRHEPARSLRDTEDDEKRCAGSARRSAFSDQGSDTNLIALAGESGPNIFGVVETPDDPKPTRRFKTLCWAYREGRPGYDAYFSGDGLQWSAYAGNPVIAGSVGDVNPLAYDPATQRYLSFVKVHQSVGRWPRRRSVGLASSADFTRWSQPRLILAPDEQDDIMGEQRIAAARDTIEFDHPDDHRTEFYGMSGFRYEGMYLGLLWVFDATMEMSRIGLSTQDGPFEVQLTAARDLYCWQRMADRKPIIPFGAPGEWDCGMVTTANAPLIVDDEIRIYYGGYALSHESKYYLAEHRAELERRIRSGEMRVPTGIGLATLRLDGWASLDAGEIEGTLQTRELIFDGSELVINAEAGSGSITAAVLDQRGLPVEGFGLEDCLPVRGDGTAQVLRWHADSRRLRGRSVRLLLAMRMARLYAVGVR